MSFFRILFFATCLASLVGNPVIANDECLKYSKLEPARLVKSPEQKAYVKNLAPEWETDENARIVRFGAYVGKDGELYEVCCFVSSLVMNVAARRMWLNRLQDLRFEPATRDGESVRVYLSFTAVSRKTENGTDSTLLLNRLLSAEKFGARYSAPQRIATQHVYGEPMWISDNRVTGSVAGEATVDVDADGLPSNARISNWETGLTRYKNVITDKMDRQCFIPGFADGEPLDMPYSEVIQQ